MVSGLVTSPEDQDRICLDDARPISIASKLLMSIKVSVPSLLVRVLLVLGGLAGLREDRFVARHRLGVHRVGDVLVAGVAGRAGLALDDLLLLGLVGRAVAARRPAAGAHAGEVDAELLGGPQQVVVLV